MVLTKEELTDLKVNLTNQNNRDIKTIVSNILYMNGRDCSDKDLKMLDFNKKSLRERTLIGLLITLYLSDEVYYSTIDTPVKSDIRLKLLTLSNELKEVSKEVDILVNSFESTGVRIDCGWDTFKTEANEWRTWGNFVCEVGEGEDSIIHIR